MKSNDEHDNGEQVTDTSTQRDSVHDFHDDKDSNSPHQEINNAPQGTEGKSSSDNPAIWFFIAAVLVAVSPAFSEALNIDVSSNMVIMVAAMLAGAGFYLLINKD